MLNIDKRKMKVTIKPVTSWERVRNAARWTINKPAIFTPVSDKFKDAMCRAEHSPLRLLEFDIYIENAPNKVVQHLVRHHEGVEKFVGTHRSDRTDFTDYEVNRNTPTNLLMSVNAQALINISRVRLCNKAEKETREVWRTVVNELAKVEPILALYCVPNCVYRGMCPEFEQCKQKRI